MKNSLSTISITLCLYAIIFSGCAEKEQHDTINGVYESLGYGRIVKIEDGQFLIADVTSKSCIPLLDGATEDLGDALQYKNDTLTFEQGINLYYFVRTEDAPAICKKESDAYKNAASKSNDPIYNFETLWETFETHYSYFDLREVNPDSMYAKYRPMVTETTSDAELFLILYEMLDEFEDGHIGIEATEEIEEAAEKLYLAKHSEDNKEEEDEVSSKERLRNHQVAAAVAEAYIPEGTSKNGGHLRWGTLQNNIGYLQINQMMGLADYGISDTLSYRDYWMAYFEKIEDLDDDTPNEIDGINASLDIIMKELANTDALIIDVRFNGGGKDEVGMAVLQRLNATEKVTFTKKGKHGTSFTPLNRVIQAASDNPYNKPVYLLIATESASATEIMALSAMSLPNITSIGARTEGVFSDILDKELPNGWTFGLSNEVYQDLNGVNYEGLGIPPKIKVEYPRNTQRFLRKVIDDLKEEGDRAIEKARTLALEEK